MPEQTSSPSSEKGSNDSRALPDPDTCRTSPIGEIDSFGTCLVQSPMPCPNAMSYGNSYLCRNRNWKAYIRP
jgi:hypothetical protein